MDRKQSSLLHSISIKIIILTIVLWTVFSGLLTWAAARDMKSDVQNSLGSFLNSNVYSVSEIEELPGQFEYECVQTFYRSNVSFGLSPILPFILPQYTSVSSDDWIYGKWHTLLGYETAVGYFDQDFNPLFTQGNYLTFEYTTEEKWQSKSLETTGYAYINLDQYPELKDLFESSPFGNIGLDSIYPAVKITGTFSGNEFIPHSIEQQGFVDSYHPVDTPDLHRIRELEDKNLITWVPIIEETDAEDDVTIYAYHLYAYRYDYESFLIDGKSTTLPEYLMNSFDINRHQEKHSIIESYMTFTVQKADGIFMAASVRFWPLYYVMLRLIPYYVASLMVVLLFSNLIIQSIKKKKNLLYLLEE